MWVFEPHQLNRSQNHDDVMLICVAESSGVISTYQPDMSLQAFYSPSSLYSYRNLQLFLVSSDYSWNMALQSLFSRLNHSKKAAPLLSSDSVEPYHPPINIPKRFHRIAVGAMILISLSLVLYAYRRGRSAESVKFDAVPDTATDHPLPPLYKQYSASEEQLPQHNLDLPFPDGRHAKYIWFSNHVRSVWRWFYCSALLDDFLDVGWGNHMQELVVNAHLAYVTKRAWVTDSLWPSTFGANTCYYTVTCLIIILGIGMVQNIQHLMENSSLPEFRFPRW